MAEFREYQVGGKTIHLPADAKPQPAFGFRGSARPAAAAEPPARAADERPR